MEKSVHLMKTRKKRATDYLRLKNPRLANFCKALESLENKYPKGTPEQPEGSPERLVLLKAMTEAILRKNADNPRFMPANFTKKHPNLVADYLFLLAAYHAHTEETPAQKRLRRGRSVKPHKPQLQTLHDMHIERRERREREQASL